MKFDRNHLALCILMMTFALSISQSMAFEDVSTINITDDGHIQFNITGFQCENQETEDNTTSFEITDSQGRWAEITIHNSSMNNPHSKEVEYMHAEFYRPWGMWIGNYSGEYYSLIVTQSSDDSYFDTEWVNGRLIFN
ncbi:MAG: hypothetical protein Q4P18_07825 [Methanobrevibacter sp.]|uniref:hypothetical protein n=1 Tax=Methanobrevibacter sp. TaxID=66852 RepID=UPI0026DEC785|nr:hypothetical protein [Methanobrevibacter sp.]MDO5849428.1 hypothetical protein [Methanobrevibacter sp.]